MRDVVAIGNYQVGFCQGRSTAGAMFILRMLQEKYSQSQKNKKLYHVVVDLEKAFDQLPRKVIVWALKRKGYLKEWYRQLWHCM